MITLEETIGFLQKVPLFQGLKKSQLELLAKRFVEREYAAGQAIVTQGQGRRGFLYHRLGQGRGPMPALRWH